MPLELEDCKEILTMLQSITKLHNTQGMKSYLAQVKKEFKLSNWGCFLSSWDWEQYR